MTRKTKVYTQAERANQFGCTQQLVSAYVNGKTGISVKMALRWSKVLNVDFAKLMTAKTRDRPKLLGLKR